jgi:nucleotide-binding universal stress UspA family protein
MSIERILVPIDFSDGSTKALDYAIFLAKKFDSEITLLHTITLSRGDINEIDGLKSYDEYMHMREDEKRLKLEKTSSQVQGEGIRINKELLKDFSAADSILKYITQKDFDLVVMGTHGHKGLKRFFLGSVAEKVSYYSPIPVISLHKNFDKKNISRLLVPISFSDHSQAAIKEGLKIAKEFGAKIEVLHVIKPDEYPESYNLIFFPLLEAKPSIKNSIRKKLRLFTGMSDGKTIFHAVKEGKIHKEIRKYAKAHKIDFIIMHPRAVSPLRHLLYGSNTDRVVRTAPCPVLSF